MRDSQTSMLLFSRLLTKALLLLLPLLVAVYALQWPPLGIRLQSPFILEDLDSTEQTTTVGEIDHPVPTNPADSQVHLPNGKHYMLDFHDVDLTFLDTADGEAFVIQEIINSGMTFLGSRSHLFPGGGLTAVFLLSESHLSIHTWPEHSFVALDIYTCGNSIAADRLVKSMYEMLRPRTAKVSYIERGSDLSHSVEVNQVVSTKTVEPEGNPDQNTTVAHPMLLNTQRLNSLVHPVTVGNPVQVSTVAHPILFSTQRPVSLVLPATADICINAAFDGEECFLWRNASLLYSQRSEIQLVEVVDRQFGERCLLLDGATQFCNSPDNELYTQSLVERVMQPLTLSTHARTEDVDIYVIGGGDGWIGTHLLSAYPSLIRSIHIIDIDPLVSDVTKEFFPVISGTDSFEDSRVQYIAGDAAMWLRNAVDLSADAVIIDCTDHTVESASTLYTDLFYSDVLRVLRPGGRFSQQMNLKEKRYDAFQKQAKETWLRLGFAEVMEWQEYIEDYGGIIVMMGGVKGKH